MFRGALTSADTLNPALCPSTPTVPLAWNGSAPEASGRIETAFRLPARSYTSTGVEMAWLTMWGLWNHAMEALCTPSRGMPIMPASSSVMPWGIGGYWGMGHFQNNGAAGGLSLRHRDYRCTGFPFLIAGDVDCFRLAVSAPFQLLAPGIVNVPGSIHAAAVQRRDHVALEVQCSTIILL